MGLLTLFSKTAPALRRLPTGSFTVDRQGSVLIGTVPSSFPAALVDEIAQAVVAAFREAEAAQLPLTQLILRYGSLRIIARELRGGAIVFLSPVAPDNES